MKAITIREILNSCKGEFFGNKKELDTKVTSIFTDSRKATAGTMFVAIKGERVDGHSFVESTYSQGAVCALVEEKSDCSIPQIKVKSTLQAVKDIAKYYRSLFKIPFIGVTGSVGKTSTKEMLASVLKEKFIVHKTQGNFNNELGVPLTLFAMEKDTEVAIIEMGISDFGEMTRLSDIVKPDYCVITNIGCCHLEFLGDRDGVLKAKTEMFINMQKDGKIFLNGDDDKLSTIKEFNEIVPIFYGLDSKNEYYSEIIENNSENGIKCNLCYDGKKIPVTVPAIGNHMVANAMAAVAIGKSLGMTDKEIVRGIESYTTISGRNNVITTENFTIIDDCYNANPTSTMASVDTVMNFKNPRKVCILGDMKELGKDELALHRQVGAHCESLGVDILLTVGALAKEMQQELKNTKGYHFESTQSLIDSLPQIIKKDDAILVKASHSMHFEEIVKALTESIKL
ncbi:MAG: UDP-N-acetylmuramoyl-tripeptide--D-alanyl-D-alanine ligase [Oscillospiraceae bacterium]|nr:UDP-N-acetylmuramoyl-tripeptide--D-alanyl-D-alanine ligase [Oscillospiraceae bacterium]